MVEVSNWPSTTLGLRGGKERFREGNYKEVRKTYEKSIEYALSHREEALSFATKYAREIKEDKAKVGRFVSMYVNQRTLDYGKDGRKAVRLLLELGYKQGIIKVPPPDVVFSDEVS